MSTWRESIPEMEKIIKSSEIYYRDPFTVVILTTTQSTKAVGCVKRNRYAKTKDMHNPAFARRVATERAYKDLYKQINQGYMETANPNETLSIPPEWIAKENDVKGLDASTV